METDPDERIVMTPKKKTRNSTTLKMERKRVVSTPVPAGSLTTPKVHVAGGSNAGIIVNKQQSGDEDDQWAATPAHLCLEFRVFLVNVATKKYTQEKRIISYWFKELFPICQRATAAQELFKKLVSPVNFPRDYVGFIKKIMKLMQLEYPMVAKIEVEMTQEKEMDELPNRPIDDEARRKEQLGPDKVLAVIEEAYPNSLTIDDMSRRFKSDKELVRNMVLELVSRKLVKPVGAGVPGAAGLDSAAGAFRRVHQNEDQVTVVKHMPRSAERALQPTIAVITAQYFEKMAVDAMMTNKQTFMRYATNGEANVYTLGDIGDHRVVSTKLPMTGHDRDALIATGSTTTRLLGTFQGVEHVFLVGVAGAVPHYTDFDRHVRLGDVVISTPPKHGQRFIYQYCESVCEKGGEIQFETRSWCPVDLGLQEIALSLIDKFRTRHSEAPWMFYYENGRDELVGDKENDGDHKANNAWSRPSNDTDKLYMCVGGGDVIEVGHPTPGEGQEDPRLNGEPVLHVGPVAAGRGVALDDQLRQELAARHEIVAFDVELDAVVESIYGNRKDQYTLIRGMADYKDGTRRKEWQQYAALMAAAVLKTVVEEMPPPPEM